MSKYLEFNLVQKKAKTDVIAVKSKRSGDVLGIIKWFGRWRQYAFFPLPETIFNVECLDDIRTYINGLMSKRKERSKATIIINRYRKEVKK